MIALETGVRRASAALSQCSDRKLAAAIGAVLFLALAWPLMLVRLPPYQDLGGHLATLTILLHPDRYAEFAPTGLLKTNSAMFAFGVLLAPHVGLFRAVKLFLLLTLLAKACILPFLVLHFRGRHAMVTAAPLMPPLVHHWFISMGMLNFALATPLALWLLIGLDRQLTDGVRVGRSIALASLAIAVWYCHSMPVCIVAVLAALWAVQGADFQEKLRRSKALLLPLVPALLLVGSTFVEHLAFRVPSMGELHPTEFSATGELFYELWTHYLFGLTEWTLASLAIALLLGVFAIRGFRQPLRMFGTAGLGALLLFYFALPSMAFDWGALGARFIPFIWAASLLRIPDRQPRWLIAASIASGLLFVAGMNADILRVSRDHEQFLAGEAYVPLGAKLLPLTFRVKKTSVNTWSLDSWSGMYVADRLTSAHDLWASNNSMPVVRRWPPLPRFDRLHLRRFVRQNQTSAAFCQSENSRGLPVEGCQLRWSGLWEELWQEISHEYDYVLLWQPPQEVLRTLPESFTTAFETDDLRILKVHN